MDKDTEAELVNQVAEVVSSLQFDLTKLAKDVVMAVEKISKKVLPLSGEEKKRIAVGVLSGYIKLPFPFSLCQKMILKLVVNHAVAKLNEIKGHNWSQTK